MIMHINIHGCMHCRVMAGKSAPVLLAGSTSPGGGGSPGGTGQGGNNNLLSSISNGYAPSGPSPNAFSFSTPPSLSNIAGNSGERTSDNVRLPGRQPLIAELSQHIICRSHCDAELTSTSYERQ